MNRGKLVRVDDDFLRDLQTIKKVRIMKGFANPLNRKEISDREMTNLLRKTMGYQTSLEELKNKPKKK